MDFLDSLYDLAMFIGVVNIIPERSVPPGQQKPLPGFNDIITEDDIQMISEAGLDLIVE
ncbi:MAG: hypothetical protein GY787_14970 [Alteromonadales bacterium]|nr:hypothetical protein [Alteromonadales bacterium]